MNNFPHAYTADVQGTNDVLLTLATKKHPQLQVSPPKEFGGSAGFWNQLHPKVEFIGSVTF